ncbi:MAG: hypothetical protein ACRDPU_09680, partial [Thermoleophilia bacterium]
MSRDLYGRAPESPAPRVSRRALLGLTRAGSHVDFELATDMLRARDYEALARAVAPVEAVLREFAAGDVLELPMTAWREIDLQVLPHADATFDSVVSAFGA